MAQKKKISKLPYSKGEEVMNSVTHGVGAVFSLIGGTILVTRASIFGGKLEIFATLVYGISLVVLFSMSTLYHAFPFPRVKQVFRVFDHSSIFLLIAGSYTPFTLIALRRSVAVHFSMSSQTIGIFIFLAIWVLALIGICLNVMDVKKFSKFSIVLYIVMGWLIIVVIKDVAASLTKGGFWLLLAGGLAYTVGVVFYVLKKIPFMHGIWHIFVIGGSILHYLCIVIYVI